MLSGVQLKVKFLLSPTFNPLTSVVLVYTVFPESASVMVISTANVVVTSSVPLLAIVMFISVGILVYIGVVVVIFLLLGLV